MLATEPKETIHIYYEREEEKKSFVFLPLFFAFLCLVSIAAVTIYSWQHPTYEHETVTIPAHFFTRTYSATATIIPTGVKTYPATAAYGILTLTNGSVVSQALPQGLIFSNGSGIEVATLASVFVPAGSAAGYGVATVPAKAVVSGSLGNMPAFSINAVYGTSLYIRNLSPFIGGSDSYSVTYATKHDRQTAIDTARASLTMQRAKIRAFLAFPCQEIAHVENSAVGLFWTCQFASYPVLPGMKITAARLVGKNLIVGVVFVAKPRRIWVK